MKFITAFLAQIHVRYNVMEIAETSSQMQRVK
jgi:hypothetical protein